MMPPMSILIFFLIYSLLGWMLDTLTRSLEARRFVRGGFSKAPISPIYGFGALLVLALAPGFRAWPLWLEGIAFGAILAVYEYASGVVVARIFGRRLWDYSRNAWNLHGRVDAFHAVAWGVLALFLIYVLHPFLSSFITPLF